LLSKRNNHNGADAEKLMSRRNKKKQKIMAYQVGQKVTLQGEEWEVIEVGEVKEFCAFQDQLVTLKKKDSNPPLTITARASEIDLM
jgi:hypothetical protein